MSELSTRKYFFRRLFTTGKPDGSEKCLDSYLNSVNTPYVLVENKLSSSSTRAHQTGQEARLQKSSAKCKHAETSSHSKLTPSCHKDEPLVGKPERRRECTPFANRCRGFLRCECLNSTLREFLPRHFRTFPRAASSSSALPLNVDQCSAISSEFPYENCQGAFTIVIYKPSTKRILQYCGDHTLLQKPSDSKSLSYFFVLPTITLTSPEDENTYCTQSPFPESVYHSCELTKSRRVQRLGVPSIPCGPFSSVSRRHWPHPSGPWLRCTAISQSPLPPGTRLKSGAIVGWSPARPWVWPIDTPSGSSTYLLSRPYPPRRIPTEEDLDQRRQARTHHCTSRR